MTLVLVSVTQVSWRAQFDLFVTCVEVSSRLSVLRRTNKNERATIPYSSLCFLVRCGIKHWKVPFLEIYPIHVPTGLKHNFYVGESISVHTWQWDSEEVTCVCLGALEFSCIRRKVWLEDREELIMIVLLTVAVMRMLVLKRKEIIWHGWGAKTESESRMPSLGGVLQAAWISCSNRAA